MNNMKKLDKIIIVMLLLGALYFIGNTAYKTIKTKKNNIEVLGVGTSKK